MLRSVSRVARTGRVAPRVAAAQAIQAPKRNFHELRDRMRDLVPERRVELKDLMKTHGDKELSGCTVSQAVGGMRGVTAMIWETSLLDAEEGIRFRGLSIPELRDQLPRRGEEPIPEALLWLLLTGEIPTQDQADSITEDLHRRAKIPAHAEEMIRSLPKDMHPMTKLSMGVMACQQGSKFQEAYRARANKLSFWEPVLEDSLDVIAKMPRLAALTYASNYRDNAVLPEDDPSLDYSQNFNRLLGFNTPDFDEVMRLYLTIHSDHEGGNVSAHTTHLVGSALSDPYLCMSAGLNGLAGPLHGLANQEVLEWTLNFMESIKKQGKEITPDSVRDQAWHTLNLGQVIPGFGHAVLRKTDPRYTIQREFALKHMPDDPLFKLISIMYDVIPQVLTEHGKTKNPWPNVDAHSGCLLTHYGLTEHEFYTVLFGVSRSFGVLSQLVWDRALGLPLERPKSVTTDWIRKNIQA